MASILNVDASHEAVPQSFAEKQVIAVSVPRAYLVESDHAAIPFTYCEVFAPRGIMSFVRIYTASFCIS